MASELFSSEFRREVSAFADGAGPALDHGRPARSVLAIMCRRDARWSGRPRPPSPETSDTSPDYRGSALETTMVNAGIALLRRVGGAGTARSAKMAENCTLPSRRWSRQIHKLEGGFRQCRCSIATRARCRLTSAGEIFLRHARSNHRLQIERVRSGAPSSTPEGPRRGTVTIQSIESLVQHLLPRAIDASASAIRHLLRRDHRRQLDHVVAAVRGPNRYRHRLLFAGRARSRATVFKIRELMVLPDGGAPSVGEGSRASRWPRAWPIRSLRRRHGNRQPHPDRCRVQGGRHPP